MAVAGRAVAVVAMAVAPRAVAVVAMVVAARAVAVVTVAGAVVAVAVVGTPVAVAVVAVAVAMSRVAVAVLALAMSPGPVAVTLHERLERLRRLLQRLLHHLRMVERRLGDGGAREQEVAGEHGRLHRKEQVDGGASASCVGAIEHVVVDHVGDHRQLAVHGISSCSLLLAQTSGQKGCVPSHADHQGVHALALTRVACANEVQRGSRGQQRRRVAKRRLGTRCSCSSRRRRAPAPR
jgi:hypothetical protein